MTEVNSNVIHITDNEQLKELIAKNDKVIIDFFAEWCGPCRQLAPVLEELANDDESDIVICKVNVDELVDVATENHIRSIPTVFFMKGGEKVKTNLGFLPKNQFIDMVNTVFK
jgi:thioredoxin 1